MAVQTGDLCRVMYMSVPLPPQPPEPAFTEFPGGTLPFSRCLWVVKLGKGYHVVSSAPVSAEQGVQEENDNIWARSQALCLQNDTRCYSLQTGATDRRIFSVFMIKDGEAGTGRRTVFIWGS